MRVISVRNGVFNSGIRNLDGAFEAAGDFQEVAALQFAQSAPTMIIDDHERDVERLKSELESEQK